MIPKFEWIGTDTGTGTSIRIDLSVAVGSVDVGVSPEGVAEQAYRLLAGEDRVLIEANHAQGLLYGIQTFLQLLEATSPKDAMANVPEAEILDWPRLPWRFVHWDSRHHQDRIETLKRYLDWMARFKMNAVSFELEDKFEYPSHPVIGAPGAFTTEQLQDLNRYALQCHIQIIPNIQSPAHLCYVLKHDAFAHLRCDESNYQICMDQPEARKLLFDMYDDACAATPGMRFLHVMDDVKDHFADRRPDLSYHIAPFEQMGLQAWLERLEVIIKSYEAGNQAGIGNDR